MANKCSFEGCECPIFVKETSLGPLCNGHYRQFKRLLAAHKPLELTPLREYKNRVADPNTKICRFDGCGRPAWGPHQFCQSHVKQLWSGKKANELEPIREWERGGSTCSIDGCDNPVKAKQLCSKHYNSLVASRKRPKQDDK